MLIRIAIVLVVLAVVLSGSAGNARAVDDAHSYACDAVRDAKNDLESAANDLEECAQRDDMTEDCSTEARESNEAAEGLETAVADAADDCY